MPKKTNKTTHVPCNGDSPSSIERQKEDLESKDATMIKEKYLQDDNGKQQLEAEARSYKEDLKKAKGDMEQMTEELKTLRLKVATLKTQRDALQQRYTEKEQELLAAQGVVSELTNVVNQLIAQNSSRGPLIINI